MNIARKGLGVVRSGKRLGTTRNLIGLPETGGSKGRLQRKRQGLVID